MLLGKNIAHLRKIRGVSQETMADELGITRSRLSSWEEYRASPPIELLIRLSEYFHVSVDSMIKMDLTKISDLRDLLKVGGNRILFPIMVDKDGNDMVELVPIKASAGYLKGYSDDNYIEALPRFSLPFLGTGKYRGFPIIGDSMPPLQEGSYVIGQFVEDLEDIQEGRTYIILTRQEGLVYKRVYTKPDDADRLWLHSDNKSYMPYPIPLEDVFEVWRFVCSINIGDAPMTDHLYDAILNIQTDVAELKRQMVR